MGQTIPGRTSKTFVALRSKLGGRIIFYPFTVQPANIRHSFPRELPHQNKLILPVHPHARGEHFFRELGNEAHDAVVINDGGGEEDELEVELIHGIGSAGFAAALALLLSELFGGFQILAFEAEQVPFGR